MRKLSLVLVALSSLIISCMVFAAPAQEVDDVVQATFQAMTEEAEPNSTGSLSGRLGYPSEAIPALRVVAFDTASDHFYYVETTYNQKAYQISGLPVGTYYVVAYTLGGGSFPAGLAGGYTQATVCGLAANCTDHSLASVTVFAGQDTPDINPNDWRFEENAFPQMPGPATAEGTGSITGSLSYLSEVIPPLRIFAYEVGTENYYYVDTLQDQRTYQIENLPVGYYYVVAYTLSGNEAGGYTEAVLCGLGSDCTDHSLIEFPVNTGQTVTEVDPGDWYATENIFPPAPVLP